MRVRVLLLAVGAILAVAGLWVSTNPIQINAGNQCGGINGDCQNVSGTVPSVAPGMALFIAGFLIAIYGVRRREDSED